MNERNLTTLIECKTKIEYLEEKIKELQEELGEFKKEAKEGKEHISDRKYALKLVLWGVTCGFVSGILSSWIIHMLSL